MSLRTVPISLTQANEHVAAWHRHNNPVIQCIFQVGAADDDNVLRSVAIVEYPKGRGNVTEDPLGWNAYLGVTLEITRLASDGTRNACSILYGACARAAFALGYRCVITYNQDDESGASLRAAGYRIVAKRPARRGWDTVSRPRDNSKYRSVQRQLWEKVA